MEGKNRNNLCLDIKKTFSLKTSICVVLDEQSWQVYFKDIIGHKEVKESLLKTIKDGHVGHALYFLGPDGSGNLPLAIAFSAYILCESPTIEDRCGECPSCKQLDTWNHPDLHFSFPIIKRKPNETSEEHIEEFVQTLKKEPYLSLKSWEKKLGGETKKSIIPTAESDYIVKALSLKSFKGGHKVLIIWRADKLHQAAANKLLKTLEEPTEKTIIILVSDSTENLLPTIVSRTQLINCGWLSDDEISQGLIRELKVDEERANEISRLANGNFNQAKILAESEVLSSENLDIFKTWMRACVKHSMPDALKSVEEITALTKDGQQGFLEYCMDFIHKSILYTYIGKDASRFDSESLEFAEKFAPYIAKSDLDGFHNVLSHGHYMIERNVNSRLLFLKISRDLMDLYQKKPRKS